MADLGVWTVEEGKPQSMARSVQVALEEHLEDWIVADPTLLPGDLTIVGRQVNLEAGQLDLLALDWQRQWVAIELKRGRLHRQVVAQALDYAASIERLDKAEFERVLLPPHSTLTDANEISLTVRDQFQTEAASDLREVRAMVVGVGTDSGLERIADYLARFDVPLTVVSYRVFEREGGPQLLVRDVAEDQPEPQQSQPKYSIDAIRRSAEETGVGAQLDRFLELSADAGLRVQPRKYAVRIAVPTDARHRLMYARPETDGLAVGVSPDKFAEFFPPLTQDDVARSVEMARDGVALSGTELDARLDQIEAFLQTLPRADGNGDDA